jgi:RNA polymerase sigma factor (sigma-70 family)
LPRWSGGTSNLVYSAALRRLGDAAEAEEVVQIVFTILAKKAGSLRHGTILSGWLYQTAQLTAANHQRAAIRRQHREQEAFMQFTEQSEPDASWHRLSPLLEEAMARLGQKDRDAIVLRFFENRTVGEVAIALGLQEDAAQKRVNRATNRLRNYFVRRGIQISSAALLASIGTHAVQAAPVELVSKIAGGAALKSALGSASTLTLKTTLKIMAWTKAKTAIVASVGVLLAAGTTTITVKEIQEHRTHSWQGPEFNFKALEQAPPQVRILPAKYPSSAGGWGQEFAGIMGLNQPASVIVKLAYGDNPRIIYSTNLLTGLPPGSYDFISSLRRDDNKALQQEVERKFDVTSKREMRETDVLLLEVKSPNAPGLKRSVERGGGGSGGRGHIGGVNMPLSQLADIVEPYLQIPILDRTSLTGRFDINLNWDDGHGAQPHNVENLKQAMLDQLGLELVPSREPVEMLVVEKTK